MAEQDMVPYPCTTDHKLLFILKKHPYKTLFVKQTVIKRNMEPLC